MNFKDKIIIEDIVDKDKVYLITLASDEDIRTGNYIDWGGVKISKNPKKHGVITNINTRSK